MKKGTLRSLLSFKMTFFVTLISFEINKLLATRSTEESFEVLKQVFVEFCRIL